MTTIPYPTLTYPNGGETVLSSTVLVTWDSKDSVDSDDRPVLFEVSYTTNYIGQQSEWIVLALLPSSARSYLWEIPNGLRTTKTRFAVVARNTAGEIGIKSISADNLTIVRNALKAPQLSSPVPNGRYDLYVKIDIKDSQSTFNYYHFSYSSLFANTPRTTIANRVPASNLPFRWKTVDLPPANDYIFYAMSVDGDGNTSETTIVSDINLTHEGFVIVDTTPPKTTIKIQTNSIFSNTNSMSVKIYAYDDATDINAIEIRESGTVKGSPQSPKTITTYDLSSGDGDKNVYLLAQDFGANRNSLDCPLFLRAIDSADGNVIDMVSVSNNGTDSVYLVTGGEDPSLYYIQNYPTRVQQLDNTPTAIGMYNDEIYIATVDDIGNGHVLKNVVGGFQSVYYFSTGDNYITKMATMGGNLYWTTNLGELFSYDGSTVSSVFSIGIPIIRLFSSDIALYLTTQDGTPWVFDGTTLIEVNI